MCSGSIAARVVMEGEDGFSIMLELAASDELVGFRRAVEEDGVDVNEARFWYGRRVGSKKMGFELRTPLMIAAMYGSKNVLTYLVGMGRVDINLASASDGATALHLAVAGAASHAPEVVRILLDALADASSVDASGNTPADLIAPATSSSFSSRRKMLELMLRGSGGVREVRESCLIYDEFVDEKREHQRPKDGNEKKEYPVDISLPDIKNGIYGTDEFRMYTFKIKPCSRAYSHDWTECPFVHPGENARRRDPRKYHYSCVPCPEFRKGSCRQGDTCEYAHGIFECWLHPAQYRTRLCKDETGCTRRVCFFAHKPEELRPLYASTGSAVPSPKSFLTNANNSLEMGSVSPLDLGSLSVLLPATSTPPMSPSRASSPMCGNVWQSNPTLQLLGSRLKSTFSARDIDLDIELLGLENQRRRQQQQLMDELLGLSSPSSWNNTASAFAAPGDQGGEMNRLGGVKPTNLEDIFDHATFSQSPSGSYFRPSINQQLRSSYPTNLPTSPAYGIEQPRASAASLLSSRATAFAKRSQSFIERSGVNRHSGPSGSAVPCALPGWNSPDGKLDWGMQGDELNKLRKSASFGFRSNGNNYPTAAVDVPSGQSPEQNQKQYHINTGGSEALPAWVEQFYMDQEQTVA